MKILNEQIEVIAAFLLDGVKPLRFRRLYNLKPADTYKIVKIIKVNKKPGFFYRNAITFTCQVKNKKIHEIKMCEILYDFDTGRWILLKI